MPDGVNDKIREIVKVLKYAIIIENKLLVSYLTIACSPSLARSCY